MIVEDVPTALAGERLDRVVAFITHLSRSEARAVVEAGGVSVDGDVVSTGKVRLQAGQAIQIDPAKFAVDEPPQPDAAIDFEVVFEDNDVIVVDKPAGLVVHPGAGRPDGTLVNGLLAQFPELEGVGEMHRPGIVHRLDSGSSGLLVVARNQAAADSLIEQFKAHEAEREYAALVWGHPEAAHAVIDAPIGRSKRDPLKMAVVADGRWARTEYTVDRLFDVPADLALITCRLETGRTHQIRVHLGSINHPLVGDPVYGQRRPRLQLDRPFLHARRLAFEHPSNGNPMEFSSELPADLSARLARLRPVGPT